MALSGLAALAKLPEAELALLDQALQFLGEQLHSQARGRFRQQGLAVTVDWLEQQVMFTRLAAAAE